MALFEQTPSGRAVSGLPRLSILPGAGELQNLGSPEQEILELRARLHALEVPFVVLLAKGQYAFELETERDGLLRDDPVGALRQGREDPLGASRTPFSGEISKGRAQHSQHLADALAQQTQVRLPQAVRAMPRRADVAGALWARRSAGDSVRHRWIGGR